MKVLLPFAFVALLSGCAITQELNYEQPHESADYGNLAIQFSGDVKRVSVTVDGELLDTRTRSTKKIELSSLPAGEYDIRVVASSWELASDIDFQETITIRPNREAAMLVSVPPKSGGYWAYTAVSYGIIMLLVW